jgi:hypothetical protein
MDTSILSLPNGKFTYRVNFQNAAYAVRNTEFDTRKACAAAIKQLVATCGPNWEKRNIPWTLMDQKGTLRIMFKRHEAIETFIDI